MNYPFKPGNAVPPRIPVVLVGCGPDAFIGPTAWLHNLIASDVYNIVGVAPSRDPGKTEQVKALLTKPGDKRKIKFSNNFAALVSKLRGKYPALTVCVATETPSHAGIILTLIGLGVKYIVVDKPFVSDLKECGAILKTAKENGAAIYVSFNHRYNEPIFALRELCAAGGAEQFEGAFLQDWIINPPDCRQAAWRLAGEFPALTDIGSHAADLVRFVLGSEVADVENVHMERRGIHEKGYDHGHCDVTLKSGATGRIAFSQTTEGHADDLYLVVHFADRSIMWRMEWNPDALFVSDSPNADVNDRSKWTQHLRGHGKLWKELNKSSGALSKNPPGHTQGWDLMWVHLFLAIAGDILKREKFPQWKKLPAQMKLPVPLASDAGKRSQQFMSRVVDVWREANPANN